MNFKTETLPLSKIEQNKGQVAGLPRNPRIIKDHRYNALKKSIEDFPEMLSLRELIVYPLINGNYICIAGNMRLAAMRTLKFTETQCKVLDKDTPVSRLAEIAIKDNNAFGETNYDILLNEWTTFNLADWGVDISDIPTDVLDDRQYVGTFEGDEVINQTDEDVEDLADEILDAAEPQGDDDQQQDPNSGRIEIPERTYPLAIVLSKANYMRWQAAKQKMQITNDTLAFVGALDMISDMLGLNDDAESETAQTETNTA
jgi:hypothetical protein